MFIRLTSIIIIKFMLLGIRIFYDIQFLFDNCIFCLIFGLLLNCYRQQKTITIITQMFSSITSGIKMSLKTDRYKVGKTSVAQGAA